MADFAFLHGGGQGSWVWDQTIAAIGLQAGHGAHRCLALDVPGCGAKRSRNTTGLTFQAIVEELVGDIERAGFADVVLVGHSQAGTVLPAMIERRPELFGQVAYVSCIAPEPELSVPEMVAMGVHGGSSTPAGRAFADPSVAQRERSRLMFCNDMGAAEAERFLDKLGLDVWPRSSAEARGWRHDHLAGIASTYVLCLQDAILLMAWQEQFAARLRCTRTARIDAGHQVMNTRPQALAEVLLAGCAS